MKQVGAIAAALDPVMSWAPDGPVGVAVSGGGDSMALLLLLRDWSGRTGRRIEAVTVDHGLRPESGAEAAAVAARCAELGVHHAVRFWPGGASRGNLQAAARSARQRLIGDWARIAGLGSVALGHTLDDQAETFLLRLARGSGVDGLAAMQPVQRLLGTVWLRPLLCLRRADLRRWLLARGEKWVEDPGNDDPRFDRVRARAALVPLAGLGLGAERLAETAGQLGRAREALDAAAFEAARRALVPGRFGELQLSPAELAAAPAEIRLRVLAGALAWVSGAIYRPRLTRLKSLLETIEAGRLGHGTTLHGCVLRPSLGSVAIRREPARVAPSVPARTACWDGRWELTPEGLDSTGISLGAVGREGLAQWPAWRRSGAAREVAETTPGLWRARTLVAAPLLGLEPAIPVRHVASVFDPWAATLLR